MSLRPEFVIPGEDGDRGLRLRYGNTRENRTQRGADVGDLFMSLVRTCRSNGVNPSHYMTAVVLSHKCFEEMFL